MLYKNMLQEHALKTNFYLLRTYFCVIIPTQQRHTIVKILVWSTDEELEAEQPKQ